MIPAHVDLYQQLQPQQAQLLASRLLSHHLVDPEQVSASVGEQLDRIDGPTVAGWCSSLSHAQVVLTLARETSPLGLETIEVLLRRPMYMCARGETGEALTDIEGRPLPLPLGHRRGEPASSEPRLQPAAPQKVTRGLGIRRDPRVIVRVAPNPKSPKSAAYARFALYRMGMSVEEARMLGVTHQDIDYDLRRGYISVMLPQDLTPDLVEMRQARTQSLPDPALHPDADQS